MMRKIGSEMKSGPCPGALRKLGRSRARRGFRIQAGGRGPQGQGDPFREILLEKFFKN
jgi:hypothetical protein